jgi:hypothetical protein
MKANTEKFGQVEIIEKTSNALVVQLANGEKKTLMTLFIKFYDENGNIITDFSSVKNQINKQVGKSTSGKKVSKIAEMQGAWMESKGYTSFNHLTKKYN